MSTTKNGAKPPKTEIEKWMEGLGIKKTDLDTMKKEHRGLKIVTIYPYDEPDETDNPDTVRFIIRPMTRKETEMVATKAGKDTNVALLNKQILKYCLVDGDRDRLEEGPVYTGLLKEIAEVNEAKSTSRKNF